MSLYLCFCSYCNCYFCTITISTRKRAIFICIQDEASRHLAPALNELRRLTGHGIRRSFRGSLALVGYSDNGRKRARWVRLKQQPRGKGPSSLMGYIPMFRLPPKRKMVLYSY